MHPVLILNAPRLIDSDRMAASAVLWTGNGERIELLLRSSRRAYEEAKTFLRQFVHVQQANDAMGDSMGDAGPWQVVQAVGRVAAHDPHVGRVLSAVAANPRNLLHPQALMQALHAPAQEPASIRRVSPRGGSVPPFSRPASGDDVMGDFFNDVAKTVGNVAQSVAANPILNAIPFVGTVASGVQAAAGLVSAASGGGGGGGKQDDARRRAQAQAQQRIQQIQANAAKGVAKAQRALREIQHVQRAERLRIAALRNDITALRQLNAIKDGMAKGDAQAIDAGKLLHLLSNPAMRQDLPWMPPPAAPDDTFEYDMDPPQDPLDYEQMAGAIVGDIMGASASRRVTDKDLGSYYDQVLQGARSRASRAAAGGSRR